jgi:putative membrane protein
MIVKRNFDPVKVSGYVWRELLLSLGVSTLVFVVFAVLGAKAIGMPFGVLGVLGTALAIFLAFRNNASFARWGEGSAAWSGILSGTRSFARLIASIVDSRKGNPQYDAALADALKRSLLRRHIAWANALRMQLRGQDDWASLQPFLSEADYHDLQTRSNKPAHLLMLQGRAIMDAMVTGTLQGFDAFTLESGGLAGFGAQQAACERIKIVPVPRQYAYFTRLFVWLFVVLTPLCLIRSVANETQVAWLVIPVSFALAFVFTVIERTGAVNEEPFENRITDVPMSYYCREIERRVADVLDEPLPPKLEPRDGYLW